MPRPVPKYDWHLTAGEPLAGERNTHRIKPKAGGKKFKQSKEPVSLPRASQGVTDVHYGSHKHIERQLGEALRAMNL